MLLQHLSETVKLLWFYLNLSDDTLDQSVSSFKRRYSWCVYDSAVVHRTQAIFHVISNRDDFSLYYLSNPISIALQNAPGRRYHLFPVILENAMTTFSASIYISYYVVSLPFVLCIVLALSAI